MSDMPEYQPCARYPRAYFKLTDLDLRDMVRGYLEAVEWLLSDCDPETGSSDTKGISDRARFDAHPDPRVSVKAYRAAVEDCRGFLGGRVTDRDVAPWNALHPEPQPVEGTVTVRKTLRRLIQDTGKDFSQAGHDFYLTRNRHGAGFWDGDWPEDIGRILTDHAHVYGETHHTFYRGRIEGE